jgi:hypothetical protein
MHYAPRTISFHSEVLHPPSPVDPAPLQRLHGKLFHGGGPLYRNFTVGYEGVVLANPCAQPGAVSLVAFLADRIQVREELTGATTEDFAQRVQSLCAEAVAARGVHTFLAHQVTLRTLVNLRHYGDSRDFLEHGMFRFGEQISAFGRAPQLLGLRLVFPATSPESGAFALRLESFHSDPRSLFIENQGAFPALSAEQGGEALRANIESTYRFATHQALQFVANFDARQKA